MNPLKIGDKYVTEDSDPWGDKPPLEAEIIDLKDEWVRYKSRTHGRPTVIFSAKKSYFRNCYTKKV